MNIVTITAGSHHRFPDDAEQALVTAQFAHAFDANDPEDVAHQAKNFTTYADALGPSRPPYVLWAPERPEDDEEWKHICIQLEDFAQIVETGTGVAVQIRY